MVIAASFRLHAPPQSPAEEMEDTTTTRSFNMIACDSRTLDHIFAPDDLRNTPKTVEGMADFA